MAYLKDKGLLNSKSVSSQALPKAQQGKNKQLKKTSTKPFHRTDLQPRVFNKVE